jgi:hypothetical protein
MPIPEEPTISCAWCGRICPLSDCCLDENGSTLPMDHFRCPECGRRYYRHHNEGTILDVGFYVPGKIEIRTEGGRE